MGFKRTCSRRAFSPVIAAIIISAVVMAVGGAVWALAQGTMTITAEDYAESVIEMTETISERFIVENVCFVDPTLFIWIYNYGEVDIVVDVYAGVDEGESGSSTDYEIPSGAFVTTEITGITLAQSSGEEVAIKVVSRRGNNAFYRYIMP